MRNNKFSESQLIEELKERFGAEMISYRPDDDELQFLDERYELENMQWSIERYYHYYDLLKSYGLEYKLIKRLEWNIVWHMENKKDSFFKSEFYKKFKDHDSVQWALAESKKD